MITMQFAVTWTSVSIAWFRKLLTGEPKLLFYLGNNLQAAMRQCRVTQDEVLSAVRSAGVETLDQVSAVILEKDGKFSVVTKSQRTGASSLDDLIS